MEEERRTRGESRNVREAGSGVPGMWRRSEREVEERKRKNAMTKEQTKGRIQMYCLISDFVFA